MDVHRTERCWLSVQHGPLDTGVADGWLRTPEAGAVVFFVGTTRRWTDGRETTKLTYEAYAPMALAEMQRIVDAAEAEWPVLRACLLHRLGVVPVSEASVIVGVATVHRADAFAACRFLLDTLKTQVPIWKQETFADGTTAWVEGPQPPALSIQPSTP